MDTTVVLLTLAGAILHPFRDMLLKGSTSVGAGYFGVMLIWMTIAIALSFCAIYLLIRRSSQMGAVQALFGGWHENLWRFVTAGATGYVSYYLILHAYQRGGDAVAVNSMRQVSIPLSVILGGLVLGELNMGSGFAWSILLALGIIVIILAK